MPLTPSQRRTLAACRSPHGTRPTPLSLLSAVWRRYLLLALAVIVALVLPTMLAYLAAGIVVGGVLRDLKRYWDIARTWPVVETVLDWDRIEALLAADRGVE